MEIRAPWQPVMRKHVDGGIMGRRMAVGRGNPVPVRHESCPRLALPCPMAGSTSSYYTYNVVHIIQSVENRHDRIPRNRSRRREQPDCRPGRLSRSTLLPTVGDPVPRPSSRSPRIPDHGRHSPLRRRGAEPRRGRPRIPPDERPGPRGEPPSGTPAGRLRAMAARDPLLRERGRPPGDHGRGPRPCRRCTGDRHHVGPSPRAEGRRDGLIPSAGPSNGTDQGHLRSGPATWTG